MNHVPFPGCLGCYSLGSWLCLFYEFYSYTKCMVWLYNPYQKQSLYMLYVWVKKTRQPDLGNVELPQHIVIFLAQHIPWVLHFEFGGRVPVSSLNRGSRMRTQRRSAAVAAPWSSSPLNTPAAETPKGNGLGIARGFGWNFCAVPVRKTELLEGDRETECEFVSRFFCFPHMNSFSKWQKQLAVSTTCHIHWNSIGWHF